MVGERGRTELYIVEYGTWIVVMHNGESCQPRVCGHYGEDRVNPDDSHGVPSCVSADVGEVSTGAGADLWNQVFSGGNLRTALERVKTNKGAAGVDGVGVEDIDVYLREHWSGIRERLDAGTYKPLPVREVMILKPSGGWRMLGVPTVVDRVICQAIAQVLTPIFDVGFVPVSFGFRPQRSAHMALKTARGFLNEGYVWVVEVDLSKYFDTVNHDMLMSRVARKVDDKRVLKLIRAYLNAGIMADGVVRCSDAGTPQGSPLSPLLSNIMLDDFDHYLASKGTKFVRYADDIRVFVRSKRAAQRALAQSGKFLEGKLKLRVNQEKSTICHAIKAELLGYGFYLVRGDQYRFRLTKATKMRVLARVKELTARSWSVSMEYRIDRLNKYLRGWLGYFALADAKVFLNRLDEHLRRRLRMCVWKQWKRIRTRIRNLCRLGVDKQKAYEWANTSKSYWRIAGSWVLTTTLTNAYWNDQNLVSAVAYWNYKHSQYSVLV
ncbi:Group II intron-encoded protein LtrA [Corynebacterium felinum]|nr:Group II intron-encoded protein LtrA [Corynebacterium felinum]